MAEAARAVVKDPVHGARRAGADERGLERREDEQQAQRQEAEARAGGQGVQLGEEQDEEPEATQGRVRQRRPEQEPDAAEQVRSLKMQGAVKTPLNSEDARQVTRDGESASGITRGQHRICHAKATTGIESPTSADDAVGLDGRHTEDEHREKKNGGERIGPASGGEDEGERAEAGPELGPEAEPERKEGRERGGDQEGGGGAGISELDGPGEAEEQTQGGKRHSRAERNRYRRTVRLRRLTAVRPVVRLPRLFGRRCVHVAQDSHQWIRAHR